MLFTETVLKGAYIIDMEPRSGSCGYVPSDMRADIKYLKIRPKRTARWKNFYPPCIDGHSPTVIPAWRLVGRSPATVISPKTSGLAVLR